MECQYRTRDGRLIFTIEGAGHKDIFESIASLQEVFESDESCGVCSRSNLRFVVRTAKKGAKEFTYFELRCSDCGARFEFGQAQDMKSLFPKRNRDAQGNETEDRSLPNRGWYKYTPHSESDEPGADEKSVRSSDPGRSASGAAAPPTHQGFDTNGPIMATQLGAIKSLCARNGVEPPDGLERWTAGQAANFIAEQTRRR